MKKIIALLLALSCALCCVALISCGDNPTPPDDGSQPGGDNPPQQNDLERVMEMYKNSHPTKATFETTQTIGSRRMSSNGTYVTGKIDGKTATVYTYSYQELGAVESDAADVTATQTGSREYMEGLGVRENGGSWDAAGTDFAPQTLALQLTAENVGNYTFKDNKLTFVLAAKYASAVLGEYVTDCDVEVTIEVDGAVVTEVTLFYTLPPVNENLSEDMDVYIVATYTYDLETPTLTK